MIDLNPKHLKTIQYILAEYIPEYEVRAFGSRVKWAAKDYSDLDLAVVGSKSLSLRQKRQLAEAFEESNLPIRVDLLDWQSISEGFRKVILEGYEVIQKARPVKQNEKPDGIYGKCEAESEWQVKVFSDCATLIRENVSPSDLGNTPYIGLEHIGENTLSLVGQGVASDVTSTKSRFREGDILFGKLRCYFRKVIRAPFDGVCSTDIWVTRAKDRVDQSFLYYCMASQSFVDFADSGSEGTRMPRAQWEWVSRHKIPLPTLSEQRRIAHILGTLDEKIELNRQINETLEATARAIFKSWFIDFDPVKAKIEGRDPSFMDTETASLFPSALQDSSLGKIPNGWEVERIGNLVEIVKGKSYRSSELAESGTALVTLKSIMRGGGYRPDGLKPYTGKYKPEQVITPGELVVSYTDVTQEAEVVGKPAIVRGDEKYQTLVASLDLGIIRPLESTVSVWFLYCLFRERHFQSHIYGYADGTTVLHLSKDGVPNYQFALPPEKIRCLFDSISKPLFAKIESNENESRTLAETRDTLLPKLLSGEIRVDDAAEILEVENGRDS